jgi:hypothetical protein
MKALRPSVARWLSAFVLWAGLASPPLRAALEGSMALQMTVQLPLLGLVGGILAWGLRSSEPHWLHEADWLGMPGVLLAVFTIVFWMLPRSLDEALADSRMDMAKFLAMPLLAGLPVASSWQRLPSLGRGFLGANAVSMLITAGGLYLSAPVRVCAYYRLDQQEAAGKALIGIAAAVGLFSLITALVGWRRET